MTLSNSAKSSSKKPPLHRARPSGVVDHDVQAAELLDRGVDQRADLALIGDVGVVRNVRVGPSSAASALPSSSSHVGDHHLGALGDEPRDDAPPEPGRTAGDDRDLAGQFVAHDADAFRGSPAAVVDDLGCFDLRAVPGAVDDGRAGARDLAGDLGGPARRQQLVAAALDHQRRHRDPLVGALARRCRRRRPAPGRRNRAAANRLPRPGRDAGFVAPLHVGVVGRVAGSENSAVDDRGASPRRWRRSRTARRRVRCAGSRRRRRSATRLRTGSTGRSEVVSTSRLIAPIELPTKCAESTPSTSQNRATCRIRMPRPSTKSTTLADSP